MSDDEVGAAVYDKYGFVIDQDNYSATLSQQKSKVQRNADRAKVNERLKKWNKMFKNWDSYAKKNPKQLKGRCHKGIPDGVRCMAWQKLVKSDKMPQKHPGIYESFVNNEYNEVNELIERDVSRTFPKHEMFREKQGLGQNALFRVLKAYSVYDSRVGYCQGMGFIAATLLFYMSEEEAFWALVQLMKEYRMQQVYEPGFPLLQQYLFQFGELQRELLPDLHAHLEKEDIQLSMYASQWFITLFLYSLPFETVVRIWDIFLLDGIKIVFKVAIALCSLARAELLKLRFEDIMAYFQKYPKKYTTAEALIPAALNIKFTREHLAELELKYKQSLDE